MYFTRKCDGPSIEEYIVYDKKKYSYLWQSIIYYNLRDEAKIWGECNVLNEKMHSLSQEEYENIFLGKWSHTSQNMW